MEELMASNSSTQSSEGGESTVAGATTVTPTPSASPAVVEANSKAADKSESAAATKDLSDAVQVVVFELADEEYAVPILDVQEIIPKGEITPFPNVASYIEGIINVRGTVATIINLAQRFNLVRKEGSARDKYIILTNVNKALFGMMVDEVTEVTKIAKTDIKATNGMDEGKVNAEYISGVAVVGERVILILNFAKILSEEAFEDIAKTTQETKATS